MATYVNVGDLDVMQYNVIDMDTGTVLGTNLVCVPADMVTEDVLSSDSDAFDLGAAFGRSLYVDLEEG